VAKKKPTVAKLKKKLDSIFSKFIRYRGGSKISHDNWICVCVTCGSTGFLKKMQCGHFMGRASNSTRYDEQNCNVQCFGCNVKQQGRQFEHAIYIDETYGQGTAMELRKKSKQLKQWKTWELEELIEHYKEKVKEFETS
jgi:hypothetical protein